MPMALPNYNLAFWLPSDPPSPATYKKIGDIVQAHPEVSRIIAILDTTSTDHGDNQRSFADYYWLIREYYRILLMALSVEQGLKVDLHVYVYPQFLNIQKLLETFPPSIIYCSSLSCLPQKLNKFPLKTVDFSQGNITATFTSRHSDFDEMLPASQNVVALGGTFDRLHAGHKLMISSAIILAKKTVVVGLTDASMLESKKFATVLLDYQHRYHDLMHFMQIFRGNHNVDVEIIALHDPYGPTITEPVMDLLVVSEETLSGATQINVIRQEKGMSELKIVPVEFVKLSDGERVSSSLIRSLIEPSTHG